MEAQPYKKEFTERDYACPHCDTRMRWIGTAKWQCECGVWTVNPDVTGGDYFTYQHKPMNTASAA